MWHDSLYRLVYLDATIYVGGLDDKVTETILWELFLQAGPVGKSATQFVGLCSVFTRVATRVTLTVSCFILGGAFFLFSSCSTLMSHSLFPLINVLGYIC